MGKNKRKRQENDENSVEYNIYRQLKRLKKSLKKHKQDRENQREKTPDVIENPEQEGKEELPNDNPQPQDSEITTEPTVEETEPTLEETEPTLEETEPTLEETEPEILDDVLGEDPTKTNKYRPSIHSDIASRWGYMTKEGLNKDLKNDLVKGQLIPENCQFLEAPILNPEIKAAISDPVYKRDRVLVSQQNILGQATAGLGVALNFMLKEKKKNLEVIKTISNAGRMLCDLFHTQSCARRSLIQFALNKDTKDIVLQTKIEKHLFGDNLSEALKAGKAINKTGSEIRYSKPQPDRNTKGSQNLALNYRGPPRKQQQRPPGPSAGRAANQKQVNRHAPQRPPVQRTAPPYKNRR